MSFIGTAEDIRNYNVLDKLELIEFNKENIKKLNYESGVYFLFDKNKQLLYIGKTVSFKQRLRQHLSCKDVQSKSFIEQVHWFAFVTHQLLPQYLSVGQYEYRIIRRLKPAMNSETLIHKALYGY